MERRAAQYGAMEDAMLLGFYDLPALRSFVEPVDQAREMEPVLRRLHLSIFGTRDAGLLGRPPSAAAAPGAPPLACAGSFASAIAEPALGADGVAVAGTSGLRSRSGRPGRVYVADGEGRIVGFAHTGVGDAPMDRLCPRPAGRRAGRLGPVGRRPAVPPGRDPGVGGAAAGRLTAAVPLHPASGRRAASR